MKAGYFKTRGTQMVNFLYTKHDSDISQLNAMNHKIVSKFDVD
jgi:hypothetical protein